jgi:replicative DNA helicase
MADNLSNYGDRFQDGVIQALLTDHTWAEQMMEVFESSHFDSKIHQAIADEYFEYCRLYKVFPTVVLLSSMFKNNSKYRYDVTLMQSMVETVNKIKRDERFNDLPYIKEHALAFARKQALKKALIGAVDQMEQNKYESIVESIKKAISVGTAPQLGHDFFNDYESRFTRVVRNCVPTGIEELDAKEILNGGLGSGEIGVIVANTGVGKSHFLTALGCNAMRKGKNVLHYTMELSETQIGMRYDSNLCDIDSSDVVDSKDAILKSYSEHPEYGKLMIKYFPTNSATVYTLRAHIERLELKEFHPDVVIIDYADVMKSSRQFDSLRHELKLIYEEVRAYAGEKKIPIWTASQGNKEGSTAEVVDLSNMSEAYGKAMVADVVLTLSRRSHEKATGQGRLFVAKNRAGRDGIVYNLNIDTSKSVFKIVGKSDSFDEVRKEQESEAKTAIKKKWEKMAGGS